MAQQEQCVICTSIVTYTGGTKADPSRLLVYHPCPLCGEYRITEQGKNWLQRKLADSPERRPLLMHAVRRMVDARPGRLVDLTREVVKAIFETGSLPEPSQQIDNLIL